MTARPRRTLPLTSRQRDIVKLVCAGWARREIAERLQLSVRTVDVHRRNIYRRLRVHTVVQLFRVAYAHGLVPRPQR